MELALVQWYHQNPQRVQEQEIQMLLVLARCFQTAPPKKELVLQMLKALEHRRIQRHLLLVLRK
jgi:hypothetical protein